MKRAIVLLGLVFLQACAAPFMAPNPNRKESTEHIKILGDSWFCSFQIIHNHMPGSNTPPYAILGLRREDQGSSYAWIKVERVWFYVGDKLVETTDEIEQGFTVLNQGNINFNLRDLGKANNYQNLRVMARLRNSWGGSYLLKFEDVSPGIVY